MEHVLNFKNDVPFDFLDKPVCKQFMNTVAVLTIVL